VLDPPGLREVLSKLAVATAAHTKFLVDDETGRSRRPLVDREDHEATSYGLSRVVCGPPQPDAFVKPSQNVGSHTTRATVISVAG
jgi:hypothetical protein